MADGGTHEVVHVGGPDLRIIACSWSHQPHLGVRRGCSNRPPQLSAATGASNLTAGNCSRVLTPNTTSTSSCSFISGGEADSLAAVANMGNEGKTRRWGSVVTLVERLAPSAVSSPSKNPPQLSTTTVAPTTATWFGLEST